MREVVLADEVLAELPVDIALRVGSAVRFIKVVEIEDCEVFCNDVACESFAKFTISLDWSNSGCWGLWFSLRLF